MRHANLASSLLFVVPGTVAAAHNDLKAAAGCAAVLATSLWYHSSYTPVARKADMATSGACIAYFMTTRAAPTLAYLGAAGCVAATIAIWRTKSRHFGSAEAPIWHACLHAVSAAGICLIINRCNTLH